MTKQELENEKITKEIEFLDKQIKNQENQPIYNFLTYSMPIIGTIIGTYFLWTKEKKKEFTEQTHRLELEHKQQIHKLELEYDISLRERRTKAYEELWNLTKVELKPNQYTKTILGK